MTQPKKPTSVPKPAKPTPQEKKHLDELLDEALDETFPASDPPAMLEPTADSRPFADKHGK